MKRTLVRTGKVAAGFVLLAAGIAMLALPGPGVLAIIGGLTLLGSEFHWARKLMDYVKASASRVLRRDRDHSA